MLINLNINTPTVNSLPINYCSSGLDKIKCYVTKP